VVVKSKAVSLVDARFSNSVTIEHWRYLNDK